MLILGLDLSTTRTGIALIHHTTGAIESLTAYKPRKGTTAYRCDTTALHVGAVLQRYQGQIVDVWAEDIGTRMIAAAIGLGRVHQAVWQIIVEHRDLTDPNADPLGLIPPAELKRFATGKGNAKKPEMRAAAQARWPEHDLTPYGDDEVDALWVAEAGRSRLVQAALDGHP